MEYISSATVEFPPGVHWTPGEVRDVEMPEGVEIPACLSPAPKAAPKAKATAIKPKAEG